MRIITGKFKGRILTSIRDRNVRPATDRVKETIFNMLQNRLSLQGAAILDLFAGSGSLGFEAISRGASSVVFVETNSHVITLLEENAKKLECLDSCVIIHSDAIEFILLSSKQFNLIFADPPYVYDEIVNLPSLIFQKKLLKREGFLIIEHSKRTEFPPSSQYKNEVTKKFGNTHVSFFTHPKNNLET